MGEAQGFQEVLTDHFYLFSRYLIPEDFIDQLVSENVLTLDDKEVITNHYVNKNRRQRTNQLIEILMTRGERGYQKFLEILEYKYPHVYSKVTNKQPRQPPADFLPSRMSDQLRILDSLPTIAQHIKDQFYTNRELDTQLTVLQQFLQVSKEENNALEQEIERMRSIRQENEQLHIQIANLENEVRENQVAINKEMQRTLAYIEARDSYQQRWEMLQVQYDELYRKYRQEQSHGATSGLRQITRTPSTQALEVETGRSMEKHYHEKFKILETDLDLYKAQCEELSNQLTSIRQNEIHLEKDLEDKKKHLSKKEREIRNLEKQLIESNGKIESFYLLINKKSQEIYELNKQRMSDQDRYNELSKEKESIFAENFEQEKKIRRLEEELQKLKARLSGSSQGEEMSSANSGSEEEILLERRKQGIKYHGRPEMCKVELRRPSHSENEDLPMNVSLPHDTLTGCPDTPTVIFEREVSWLRYSLRQASMTTQPESYRQFHTNNKDSLSEPLHLSRTPEEGPNEPRPRPLPVTQAVAPIPREGKILCDSEPDSDDEQSDVIPHLSHDVYTVLLPKRCSKIVRPGQVDKDCRIVTLRFPINEKIELCGGNHTGIFISKVLKNVDLSPGEEIKEVIFTPNEHVHPLVVSVKGCTLEEVYRLLSEDFIRRKKEREVRISVKKCAEDHDAMKRWLAENNNTGDYFFVRCNVSLESKNEEEVSLKAGDVFLVTNSLYDQEKRQWQGHRVDLFTSLVDEHTYVVIPNLQESNLRRFKSLRQNTSEDESKQFGRTAGIKVRGQPYNRVLPMKAFVKLPVFVIGPITLVTLLMGQIATKLRTEFIVQTSDCMHEEEHMCSNNVHLVKKGKIDAVLSRRSVQRIVIFVCADQEMCQEEAKVIFGSDFQGNINRDVVDQSTNIRIKLKEYGQNFEELCVTRIHNERSFLAEFRSRVQGSQDRVLWLCSKEMDPDITERHREILGPSLDIHELNAQLQNAQCSDQASLLS